jgi:hypothetical protein
VKRVILLILVSYSLSKAQTCSTNNYFKKGAEFEVTNFDNKNKVISKSKSRVLDIKSSGNTTEANVETKSFNAKGKEQMGTNVIVKCNNNSISMSMKGLINAEQMAGLKDMEMKIDETYLDYPSSLNIGNNLKDGNFKADMYTGGTKLMTMNLSVSDRKVVAKEEIETTAGKIACYKINYKGNIKTIVSMTYDVSEWYSPKYGVVKTETYKNGKSMGYSILTNSNM